MRRRALLALGSTALAAALRDATAGEVPALAFPRDHGAHRDTRIEWWYLTGWQGPLAAPTHGFQVTVFRARTGLAEDSPSALAPRQLLFAHAALTDLGAGTHRHAERIARWNGDPGAALAAAAIGDAALRVGGWSLRRDGAGWQVDAAAPEAGFALRLSLASTQPLLLQGDAGFSRKGPDPAQFSRYVSEPQLALRMPAGGGRGWMDHEWSDELLHPDAVGWDWAGLNLADGAALTVFRLRRADGSVLWAGGSWRPAGGAVRSFAPEQVSMQPGRAWTSARTGARYPVAWTIRTPAGVHRLEALLDGQELDARANTGSAYWEGLSALADADGRRVGLGYLEMTGYAGRLRL